MPTVIQVHFMHSLARTISARTIEKARALLTHLSRMEIPSFII